MGREKILIADDDRDLLEGLTFLFRSDGYQVVSAMDGVSAFSLAQTKNPDLIILDLSMPWMDGYKVIERLNSLGGTAEIPIIILSGRDALINQDRAIKVGAKAFFHKPFDTNELLACVENILQQRRAIGTKTAPI